MFSYVFNATTPPAPVVWVWWPPPAPVVWVWVWWPPNGKTPPAPPCGVGVGVVAASLSLSPLWCGCGCGGRLKCASPAIPCGTWFGVGGPSEILKTAREVVVRHVKSL